jgi:magnesium transporter
MLRRKKQKQKLKSKLGMPPGTPVFTGLQKMADVDMASICYSEDDYCENNPKTIDEIIDTIKKSKGVTWINIDGLHDVAVVEAICEYLDIHKLSVEDILSVGQRPKLEDFSHYLHAVIKEITIDQDDEAIEQEQISFILKGNILVSFQERTGDVCAARQCCG